MLWEAFCTACSALLYCLGALFAVIVAKAVYIARLQLRNYRALSAYDGPAPVPVLGNVAYRKEHRDTMCHYHAANIAQYCTEQKPCYRLLAPLIFTGLGGRMNELVTADPRIVKHVTSDKFDRWSRSQDNGRYLDAVLHWMGGGIFTFDHGEYAEYPRDHGLAWRTQRMATSAVFTKRLFQTYYHEVFQGCARRLVTRLQSEVGVRGERPVDMLEVAKHYVVDCLGGSIFGEDLVSSLATEGGAFRQAFEKSQTKVFDAIMGTLGQHLLREMLPDALGNPFMRYLVEPFSSDFRELKQHSQHMRDFARSLLRRRAAGEDSGNEGKADVLTLCLKLMQHGDDGRRLTEDEAVQLALHFLVAGHDTTASQLCWALYRLGLPENRAIRETLAAELDAVLQGAVPEAADLDSLPYLRGVIWETLRMHPIACRIETVAKCDDVFPDGVAVPKGTGLTIDVRAMGLSRDLWGDDADTFTPTRWIPFKQRPLHEMPVFKAGRRMCLGKDMVVVQMSLGLAALMQAFVPEVVSPEHVTYGNMFMLTVRDSAAEKDQLMMRMVPRQQAASSVVSS